MKDYEKQIADYVAASQERSERIRALKNEIRAIEVEEPVKALELRGRIATLTRQNKEAGEAIQPAYRAQAEATLATFPAQLAAVDAELERERQAMIAACDAIPAHQEHIRELVDKRNDLARRAEGSANAVGHGHIPETTYEVQIRPVIAHMHKTTNYGQHVHILSR